MEIMSMENFNVPNGLTLGRLLGVAHEAIRYTQTDELRHIIKAGVYFLLDVADGPAARALHQETEFGAAFDPFVDKASVVALGAAAITQKEVDMPVLFALSAINGSNILATTVASSRGTLDIHSVDRVGKISQLGMNMGAGLNIIGNNLRKSEEKSKRITGSVLRYSGGVLAVSMAATKGLQATKGYWKQALKRKT
jgi:phosphatidylglycerophosphate synthase